MSKSLPEVDRNNIPKHIAVIMDGNGRWAKQKGAMRIFGHRNAIGAVRDTVEGCAELGVQFLTLYTFSTENWGRPQDEVKGLMELLVHTIAGELPTLMKNNIRLKTIGDIAALPGDCQQSLAKAMAATENNSHMTLTLALNYSSRWEISHAVKALMTAAKNGEMAPEDLTEANFGQYLSGGFMPDPELLIRTSGEMRISNFLLWQLAYTELYITQTLWPDFSKAELYSAVADYQVRERRFGRLSSQ